MPKLSPAAQKRANAKRKATIARNKRAKSRKTVSRKRRTSTATRLKRKCPLNTYVDDDGRCVKQPCLDDYGRPVPFATRGSDGVCRLKKCGTGMILDPETGRCISTKTPTGQKLALMKRYDDAQRFVVNFENSHPGKPAGYYTSFNAMAFNDERQRIRSERNEELVKRQREAFLKKQRLKDEALANKNFVQRLSSGLSRNGFDRDLGDKRPNLNGGSAFSFF